jgi:hypothetical protein
MSSNFSSHKSTRRLIVRKLFFAAGYAFAAYCALRAVAAGFGIQAMTALLGG